MARLNCNCSGGAFKEMKKANIEDEKPNIDVLKANMGDTFTPITKRQILTLFHVLGSKSFLEGRMFRKSS